MEKTGAHDIVVSIEDFKKSKVYNIKWCTIASFIEGWAIPRTDLIMKSNIGKGEFGGNNYMYKVC